MLSRWFSVGLSAAMFPLLFATSVGGVGSTGWEQPEQNLVLSAGGELPSQLLAATTQERRVALIIGNGNYEGSGKLNNPPNDARDMAAALKGLGFEVTLRLDLSHQEMEEEVERFNRQLSQGGVGLFYYAGHGVQVAGENYLIPVRAKINREQDIRYKAVPLGQVLGAMEDAGNRLNIVILDACRDNPSMRRFSRSLNRGLAPIFREPEGMLIAYATAPGDVANDGEGRNSPYTASLLEHIVKPEVPLPLLFANVRRSVRQRTSGSQSPRYVSSVDGNFFFRSSTPAPVSATHSRLTPSVGESSQPTTSVLSPSPSSPKPRLNTTVRSYTRLRSLLSAGQWEEADLETNKVIRQAAGLDNRGRSSLPDVESQNFSCEDLRVIDRLWLDASDGRFGFSVQSQIYQELGGMQEADLDLHIWQNLGERVGWIIGGRWIDDSDLTFKLNALRGHLPTHLGYGTRQEVVTAGASRRIPGGPRRVPSPLASWNCSF